MIEFTFSSKDPHIILIQFLTKDFDCLAIFNVIYFLFCLCLFQHVPTYTIAEEMTGFGASVLEGLLTFALVYTVYAARDPRRGPLSSTGTLAVGLIAGANVLAAGPFSGGSMNPACAFGSAAIGGSFRNQAVYWVGPLLGAAVAGLLYDNVVFPSRATDSIRGVSDGVGV